VYADDNDRTVRLILLAVALTHIALVYWAMQSRYLIDRGSREWSTSLVLINLPPVRRPPVEIRSLPNSKLQSDLTNSSTIRLGSPVQATQTSPSTQSQSAPPDIDWAHELELAASNSVSTDERERSYRDLSVLTPAQQKWLIDDHYQPVKSGIAWKPSRVEISEGGFPIIHLGNHCVAIPLMMMMVFCKF
jgi:hypothetical protein